MEQYIDWQPGEQALCRPPPVLGPLPACCYRGPVRAALCAPPYAVCSDHLILEPHAFAPQPQDWAFPPNLAMLALSFCNFSGPLPAWRLPDTVKYLYLGKQGQASRAAASSRCTCRGGRPSPFRSRPAARNSLTGTISIRLPASLRELTLASNLLSGTIAPGWRLPEGGAAISPRLLSMKDLPSVPYYSVTACPYRCIPLLPAPHSPVPGMRSLA